MYTYSSNHTKKSDRFGSWIFSKGVVGNKTPSNKLLPRDTTFIYDLSSPNLFFYRPMYVRVTPMEKDYYVEQDVLELWARNTSLEKAFTDIQLQIASLYKKLKEVGEKRLGPAAKKYWQFLKEYMENR